MQGADRHVGKKILQKIKYFIIHSESLLQCSHDN